MRVSRTMAYAVQALLQLARADTTSPIPCSFLAHEGMLPERFLLQILRTLVTHGLLKSSRGVDGGYTLARAPKDISLMDVFDAFDNPLIPSVPPLEKLPEETRGMLNESLSKAAAAARNELANLSLEDLLSPASID